MSRSNLVKGLFIGAFALFVITNSVYLISKHGVVGSYYAVKHKLGEYASTFASHQPVSASEKPSVNLSGLPFDETIIDDTTAGDCKMVGDIDGDGNPDLVIGGMPNEKLNWYRYPNWEKTVIATPAIEFTTDGALGDVDGDGDLDILVPDGDAGNNLLWFENPAPQGDPSVGDLWVRHEIGTIGGWGKDVKPSDYDGDGRLDVVVRSEGQAMLFFQSSPGVWNQVFFENVDTGKEGMAKGDLDGDGDTDLILRGVWLRNPGGPLAQTPSNWTQYTIGDADQDFKALVVDLNADGTMDVLFSSSENTADVNWWTPANGDPTGAWEKSTILPGLEKAHTLQAADMDGDGDLDVVLGQMHTAASAELMIMINRDGQALDWDKQVIGQGGLHNGVVADIGNDGDFDIFGSNWTGNPPVRLWMNRQDQTGQWVYKQVTEAHQQTFGLGFGDVNGDSQQDILSGRYWYQNPGGDLMGDWPQTAFPEGMHAALFVDVDGDEFADVIAQKDEGDNSLYWLEAADSAGSTWNSVKIGAVPQASHTLGAQGYRLAQVEAGGKPEILFSSGDGIYYFRVPKNPQEGGWPQVHVSSNPSDEGLAAGDIDGDGDLDIAATTGDAKGVEWYQNPSDSSTDWTAFPIGLFADAVYPDRIEATDLSGDGKLDIIVTEENGEDSSAETYWWEQPADPTAADWSQHLIVSQATTNSMDTADIDQDGDIDIVLGEHRGEKKLTLWLNDGTGQFTASLVSSGKESHLGAKLVDLDGDQDLDIVSIAWDDFGRLHLWRNDMQKGTPAVEETLPPQLTETPEVVVPTATEEALAAVTPQPQPSTPEALPTSEAVVADAEQTKEEPRSIAVRNIALLCATPAILLVLGLASFFIFRRGKK